MRTTLKNNFFILPIFFFLVLFNQHGSHATTLIKKSLTDLVTESKDIIHVITTEVQSGPTSDGKSATTTVTFKVLESIKSKYFKGEVLSLHFKGGQFSEDEIIFIPGTPTFKTGNESILFLREAEDGPHNLYPVLGWEQGHFSIKKNNKKGKKAVYNFRGQTVTGIEGLSLQLSSNSTVKSDRPQPHFVDSKDDSNIPFPSEKQVATGISTTPITVADFKQKLKELSLELNK